MSEDLINKKFFIEGEEVHLKLTEPIGAGGGYHVMVNNYYRGCVVSCINTGWSAHVSDSVLTQRIINWILDIVKQRYQIRNKPATRHSPYRIFQTRIWYSETPYSYFFTKGR